MVVFYEFRRNNRSVVDVIIDQLLRWLFWPIEWAKLCRITSHKHTSHKYYERHKNLKMWKIHIWRNICVNLRFLTNLTFAAGDIYRKVWKNSPLSSLLIKTQNTLLFRPLRTANRKWPWLLSKHLRISKLHSFCSWGWRNIRTDIGGGKRQHLAHYSGRKDHLIESSCDYQ